MASKYYCNPSSGKHLCLSVGLSY